MRLKLLLAVTLGAIIAGCGSREQGCRQSIRDRFIYQNRLIADSIYNRDTIRIYFAGDTIVRQEVKWRERWRLRTDTLYIAHRDSTHVQSDNGRKPGGRTRWRKRPLLFLGISAALGLWAGYALRRSLPLR